MKGARAPLVMCKLCFFYPAGTLGAGGRGRWRGAQCTIWSIPALTQALAPSPPYLSHTPTPNPHPYVSWYFAAFQIPLMPDASRKPSSLSPLPDLSQHIIRVFSKFGLTSLLRVLEWEYWVHN